MRKKIISAIMLAVLMNIFCIEGVQAEGANKENIDEKLYTEDNSFWESGEVKRQYYFNGNVLRNSDSEMINITLLEDCIKQVVFEILIGDEIIKVGLVFQQEFLMDALNQRVDSIIEELIEMYGTEITNENVRLYCIETKENSARTNEIIDLQDLKEVIEVTPEVIKQIEPADLLDISKEVYGINEQYHINYANMILLHDSRTNKNTRCVPTLSSPHYGDGNNRYESGYQWFPGKVNVVFNEGLFSGMRKHQVELSYCYSEDELGNLAFDDNEALEMEITFYNYNPNTMDEIYEADCGYSYIDTSSDFDYFTNQPSEYLDTSFGDSDCEVNFCVGVDDATNLEPGVNYYFRARFDGNERQGYPNDGRFRVTAQRGYRFIGHGEWSVFAEEHDPIRSLGISEDMNWVSESAYDIWQWNFNSDTDFVS